MAQTDLAPYLAPVDAFGKEQIMPNRGPHIPVYANHDAIVALVVFGIIKYDEDYGPRARVYRPVGAADTDKIRSWLEEGDG